MILAAGMTVTLTLSDLLMLTIIGCLIVLTVYLVLTLKGYYMTDALTNGHGIFKIFSVMNRQR